jgi:Amt family ammonium transporter
MISGKPNVSMTLNGALAGLVGITAGCANVNNLGAVLIGLVSGVLVVYSINFIEKRGIDDAVGAISVHGVCGAWGVLAVAFFDTADGLLYGGTSLFVPQIVGILAIGTWAFVTSYGVLKAIDSVLGLRVTPEEEIAGLDASEHGTSAYGDFITKK